MTAKHRLDLATLTTEAGRAPAVEDPVVEALRLVRTQLADSGGAWLAARAQHRPEIQALVENTLADLALTDRERSAAMQTLDQDLFGWGRLEPYMADPSITEIIVDSWDAVDIERKGQLEHVNVQWRNHGELLEYIKGLIRETGRPLDEGHPIVDVEVHGARINATAPPVSTSCTLNIRKSTQQTQRYSPEAFVAAGGCDWATMRLILACVRGAATTMMCGPMGAAKTTMVRIAIEEGAPADTRWLVLEDVREIEAHVRRFVSLQTVLRKENPVTMTDLFTAVKRKRPDRVSVGEVRSYYEALPFIQSVQMGHPGGITATHAGTPRQALSNFVFYLKQGGMNIQDDFLLQVLHESLDLLVFVRRYRNGKRRITRITEVVPVGDPDCPDGFRDLIRLNHDTHRWEWMHPLSRDLADRLTIEGVRVPQPEDEVGPDDITPAALDLPPEAMDW